MNETSYFAGIDVSKPFLDLHLLPTQQEQRVANDAAGHRKLLKLLQAQPVQMVVLEATGGYEHAVVKMLVNAGVAVHVAQPQVIRAHRVAKKIRAKTDKIDAGLCALYAQDNASQLRKMEAIDPLQQKLQALVVRRGQLVEMSTMERNRLQQADDKQTCQSIKRSLACLATELKRIEKQVDQLINNDPALQQKSQTLQQSEGVGPQTARLLIACLPELGKTDSKRLNALVGVAPYANDSGKRAGPRAIEGGRKIVRNGLYMACMTAATDNPFIRAYHEKLIARGLAYKTAMMACIRKLLNYLNMQLHKLQPPHNDAIPTP